MKRESYRLQYHLMPPTGWMNDPNGLCYYQDAYHVFFQYSPGDPLGSIKYWGHYRTKNLVDWEYLGIAVRSDCAWDKDGAYSGCGFTEDGILELFYTGNVKEEGEHDYVHSGRGANVIRITSDDGLVFSEKELLLSNKDYPKDYTCHIRDPKVWKTDDTYYMLLGGRKRQKRALGNGTEAMEIGAILQYESKDKIHWNYTGEVTTEEPFGYMWECPDVFSLEGTTVLMCCPQGVERETYRFQNVHQAGYFLLADREKENLNGTCKKEQFHEFDFGYDFYAPQTMLDPKGRRVLFGWAGMSEMEMEFHNQPTIEEGWQHSLTVPRELKLCHDKVYQYPVEELDKLREESFFIENGISEVFAKSFDCEILWKKDAERKECRLGEEVQFLWENGVFTVNFEEQCGCGRMRRQIQLESLEEIRILKDVSMLEVFLNHGEFVFTSRYYPKNTTTTKIEINGEKQAVVYTMRKMEVVCDVDTREER